MLRRITVLSAALAALAALAAPGANAAAFKLQLSFSQKPALLTRDNTPTFGLLRNVHFGVKSQTCRIDTGKWTACAVIWKPGRVRDGRHTAQARLVMNDHRTVAASYTWTTDTTAPAAPTLSGASSSWVSAGSQVVGVHASDPNGIASYGYRLNGGDLQTITNGELTINTQGTTNISITATDMAGNVSATATGTVKLDDVAPVVSAPVNLSSWTGNISIALPAASDMTSGVADTQWRGSNDSSLTWTAWSNTPTVTVPSDGSWTFQYRASDQAGNQTTVSFIQGQDSFIPVVTTMNSSAMQVEFTFAPTSNVAGPAVNYEIVGLMNGHQFFDHVYADGDLGAPPAFGFYSNNCGDVIEGQVRALGANGIWSDWSPITNDSTFVTC